MGQSQEHRRGNISGCVRSREKSILHGKILSRGISIKKIQKREEEERGREKNIGFAHFCPKDF
jgi:hypothetical protein